MDRTELRQGHWVSWAFLGDQDFRWNDKYKDNWSQPARFTQLLTMDRTGTESPAVDFLGRCIWPFSFPLLLALKSLRTKHTPYLSLSHLLISGN